MRVCPARGIKKNSRPKTLRSSARRPLSCLTPAGPRTDRVKQAERAKKNSGMLNALALIEETRKEMKPKKDPKDYLREARSGEMYGFGDH